MNGAQGYCHNRPFKQVQESCWLLAVLMVVPLVTKVAFSVCYEFVVCLHITCSLCPGLSRSSKLQPNVIDFAQLVINYGQRKA